MLAMPPKDPVSSTAVQHSDGVSNTRIRRVDHHAEIQREFYVELTTLERTSTTPRLRRPRTLVRHPRNQVEIRRRRMDATVLLVKALGGAWTAATLPKLSELNHSSKEDALP
jgi:hypothetical protein